MRKNEAGIGDDGAAGGSSRPQFVLGVDLDGVCVDFYAELRQVAAEWLEVKPETLTRDVTFDMPEWHLEPMGGYDHLHRFAVIQRQLFAKAPPIPGAAAALRRLSVDDALRIRIITDRLHIRHFHKVAITQTIEWLDYHGIPYWDLCLLGDKAAVGADLYIDDTPQNVEALRRRGLDTIVFTNSTNRHVGPPRADTWEELEDMVSARLETWRGSRARGQQPPGVA